MKTMRVPLSHYKKSTTLSKKQKKKLKGNLTFYKKTQDYSSFLLKKFIITRWKGGNSIIM